MAWPLGCLGGEKRPVSESLASGRFMKMPYNAEVDEVFSKWRMQARPYGQTGWKGMIVRGPRPIPGRSGRRFVRL